MNESNHQTSLKREATEPLQELKTSKKKLKTLSSSSSSEISKEDESLLDENSAMSDDDPESESTKSVHQNSYDEIQNKRLQRKNKFDRNRKIFIRPKELEDEDVQGWYFTKKPVGIFTYWDGKDLYSYSGCKYKPPSKFIKDFPEGYPLLGVLHKPRADLAEHRQIVCQKGEKAADWLDLKFSVYDTPEGDRKFKNRIEEIRSSLAENSSYVELSKYQKFNSEIDILKGIRELDQKGEAIYFRHGEKPYRSGLGGGFVQLFPENNFGKSAIKRFYQSALIKKLDVKNLFL